MLHSPLLVVKSCLMESQQYEETKNSSLQLLLKNLTETTIHSMRSVRGGPRRPNTTVYFIALAGILVLLALLCCYFVYFCISKVKELTREDSPLQQAATSAAARTSYPVQPVVRESATAMAKLCKQIPAGKGDTVFPVSSPAATDVATPAVAAGDHGSGVAGDAGPAGTEKAAPAPAAPLTDMTAAAS